MPASANTARQSISSLSMTPTGTPATVASDVPADVNITARPSLSGPAIRTATVIDIDQNVLSAAPNRKRARSTRTRFGAIATMRLDAAAASAIHTSSERRSRRGKTIPTVGATMRPTSAVTVTV